MAALPLGLNAYQRTGLPEVRLENFFPEQAPTSSTGSALLPFPGLSAYATRGTGSIRGLYQQDGVFSGDQFTVSGTTLYRNATSLGAIAGTDDVEFAARAGRLYILGNGTVYEYDGATLAAMAFPDSASVSSICDLKGICYAARADTGRIYYLLVGETAWQALDYQTAEAEEDEVLALRANADEVVAFGSSTVQFFYPTGNAEQPLQSADGRSYSLGIRHRDTARCMDNAVFWVDEQGRVVRDGGVVSNYGIAERIGRATSLRAFDFAWQGHEFYALEIGGEGTFLYDLSAGTWSERASYNATVWKGRCARQIGATVLIGGSASGAVYQLDADALTDDGDPIVRVFTCAVPAQAGGRVTNLQLNCSVGNAATEPEIGVRWTDDQGRTFNEWRYVSLGDTGEYRTRVVWRALGMMDFPGRVYEFRCSDAVALRVSGADYNVPTGGRSR